MKKTAKRLLGVATSLLIATSGVVLTAVPASAAVSPDAMGLIEKQAEEQQAEAELLTFTPPSDLGWVNVRDFGALGDGVANDTRAIDDALDAVPVGGTVFFPVGRYMTNGGHVINKHGVTLRGMASTSYDGPGLHLLGGSNSDMITIGALRVTLLEFAIHGKRELQSAPSRGIVVTNGSNYFKFDEVWVEEFNGDGMYAGGSELGTFSGTITSSEFRQNEGTGMSFGAGSADVIVSDTYVNRNGQSGAHLSQTGDISFTSCHFWGNGMAKSGPYRNNITVQASEGCRFVNCFIESSLNGSGIYFTDGNNYGHIVQGCDFWINNNLGLAAFGVKDMVVFGNVFRDNNRSKTGGGWGSGMYIQDCQEINTSANIFFDQQGKTGTQNYGYFESGLGNAHCRFWGNIARDDDHVIAGYVIAEGKYPTIVDSVDGGGQETPAAPAAPAAPTAPTAPTGLATSRVQPRSFVTSWKLVVGATSYRVFVGSTQVGTTTGTSLTIGNREVATKYSVTVKAVNTVGVSPASNALAVTTAKQPTKVVIKTAKKTVPKKGKARYTVAGSMTGLVAPKAGSVLLIRNGARIGTATVKANGTYTIVSRVVKNTTSAKITVRYQGNAKNAVSTSAVRIVH